MLGILGKQGFSVWKNKLYADRFSNRDGIFKLLRSTGIDSVSLATRQAGNRFLGPPLTRLTNSGFDVMTNEAEG